MPQPRAVNLKLKSEPDTKLEILENFQLEQDQKYSLISNSLCGSTQVKKADYLDQ